MKHYLLQTSLLLPDIGMFLPLLLSERQTVVKCICECNQSGRRVVFDPELVAMSTAFCSVSAL